MEYRKLGDTGIEVSVVGLGCNNFGGMWDAGQTLDQSRRVIDAALDAGVTLFDTAPVYGMGGSEAHLGEALGKRRGQAVIATKFGHPGEAAGANGSKAYVRQAI